MPASPDHEDHWLSERIADAVAALDSAPPEVLSAARSAYDLREPAEAVRIAELREDSAVQPSTGMRGPSGFAEEPRYLEFGGAGLAVRVEVTAREDRRDLLGEVAPAEGVTAVLVRWPQGRSGQPVHSAGGFAARDVPAGPVSLVLYGPAAAPVVTDWLCL